MDTISEYIYLIIGGIVVIVVVGFGAHHYGYIGGSVQDSYNAKAAKYEAMGKDLSKTEEAIRKRAEKRVTLSPPPTAPKAQPVQPDPPQQTAPQSQPTPSGV